MKSKKQILDEADRARKQQKDEADNFRNKHPPGTVWDEAIAVQQSFQEGWIRALEWVQGKK